MSQILIKKFLYLKDPYEAVYQLLINKREFKGLKYSNNSKGFIESLHEKPYFPSPGISWKAQKALKAQEVNVIFPSTLWLKKRSCFPSPKGSKQELSVISKYHLSINLLAQKKTVCPISKKIKARSYQ